MSPVPAGVVIPVAIEGCREAVKPPAQALPWRLRGIAIPRRIISFEEFKQVHCRASFAVLAQRLAASTKMDEPGSHQAKARPALPASVDAY